MKYYIKVTCAFKWARKLPRKRVTYESAKCVPCNTRKCTHNGFVSDLLKSALKCRFYATGPRDSSCAVSGLGQAFFLAASASRGRNTQGDMLQQHVAARSRSDKSPLAYWRIFVKIFVSAIEFCRRNKLHTNKIWLSSCKLLQKNPATLQSTSPNKRRTDFQ